MGEYNQATHNEFTNVNFNGDVLVNSRRTKDAQGWTWKTWFQGFGSSKIDKCLRSLHFEEYQARRMNVTDRDPHTFEWIWEHSGFRKWEQSTTSSLLWLQGKPASGKSTMMKYIRLDLNKRLTKKSFAIDFFYSDRGGSTQRGHEWMLRSLLYQILNKRRDVWKYYREEFKNFNQKSPAELQLKTLKAIFYNFQKSCRSAMVVFVLIDAMDESDVEKREDILNMLSGVCDVKGRVVLKVLVASRPIPRIQSALQEYITITLEDETKKDIECFVLERMEKIRKILRVEKTEVRDISDMVVKRSQCVFLWVKLVLDELEDLANTGWAPSQIKHELEKIPEKLGELYGRTLQRLEKAGRLKVGTPKYTETLRMLQWVAHSEYSFDPLELLEAIAVGTSGELSLNLLQERRVISYDQAVRKLQDRCGGFLEVKNGVVQFIHQTVREFFFGLPAESSLYLPKQDGIEIIVTTCLRYIKFINTQLSPGCKSQDPKIQDIPLQFLNSSRLILLNYAVYQYQYQNPDLSDASQQGNTVFQDLESARQEFISLISTLFTRAIDFDRHQDINVLLNNGVKISLGQEDISKLLDKKIKNEKWGMIDALIKHRLMEGNIDQTIYNTISQKHKLANKDHRMERLLDYAASNGYEALVQLSLVNGEDINFRNKNSWTAFHFAISGGHVAAVNLLLEHGADKEAKTSEGLTALHLACAHGCDDIAKFLIKKLGASKTAKNDAGQIPLRLLIKYMYVFKI